MGCSLVKITDAPAWLPSRPDRGRRFLHTSDYVSARGDNVSTHEEGHGRPESGPPGGLVEVCRRWEQAGGHWKC